MDPGTLLTQVPVEASTIPPGWVGAGMLGAVLSWLILVYLPAKDKQIKEIMACNNDLTRWMILEWKGMLDRKDAQIMGLIQQREPKPSPPDAPT